MLAGLVDIKGGDDRFYNNILVGKAKIPGLAYENPDGSPLKVDTDYFGKRRPKASPTPGPFENPGEGDLRLKVW